MLWTTPYIQRLAIEAECEIARIVPCVIDRVSVAIDAGAGAYQLPDYVQDIIRVFWKGFRLEALPQIHEESPWTYDSLSIGGVPTSYWYSKYGENAIRLYPTPNEDLPAYAEHLWNENVPLCFIVEFYRIPDEFHKIPRYIRRRVIKAYVCWKAFAKEGDGQNLKAAEYWKNQFIVQMHRTQIIIENITKALVRKRIPDSSNQNCGKPKGPMLPWNWMTTTVDDDC